jgi:hypothetical protein
VTAGPGTRQVFCEIVDRAGKTAKEDPAGGGGYAGEEEIFFSQGDLSSFV